VSKVKRGNKDERPTWEYATEVERQNPRASQLDVLEMLESIRNVLEEVRDRLPQRRRKFATIEPAQPEKSA
jgi:hypothetical protein